MKNLKLYIALSYGLIWLMGGAFYLTGTNVSSYAGASTYWVSICMLIPLVSTLICQKVNKQPLLRGIGVNWKVNRWWFVGWLLIPVVCLLTILFNYFLSDFSTENTPIEAVCSAFHTTPAIAVAITIAIGMIAGATLNALFAFGEESGWRGYLLKQLENKSFLSVAVATGILWGLWHAPIILLGYNYPQHPQIGVLYMVVLCILLTLIIQYIRIKSGSVIVAAIMHGTFNALAGTVLLFIEIPPNDLLDGGTGLAGLLALLVVAIVLFLFDRYVTRERIFTSPVNLDTIKAVHSR